MFPLWDDVPAQRIPVLNYAIIAVCAVVFLIQLGQPQESSVRKFGMIPLRLTHPGQQVAQLVGRDEEGRLVQEVVNLRSPVAPAMTLLTSMFLHAGWMHLIGNMWFLFIFGDNVEDRFGHLRYLLIYLLSGVAAGLVHVISAPNSVTPTIGASGAIAGVMGSYLLLYPRARVIALIPLGLLTRVMPVPAVFFLGFWFLIQLVFGLVEHPGMGGVAWWAHVGGFATGTGATLLMRQVGWLQPPPRPLLVDGFPQYHEERQSWESF